LRSKLSSRLQGRRIILRDLVCHGERLSATRAYDWYFADPMACTIINDALAWRYPEEPLVLCMSHHSRLGRV